MKKLISMVASVLIAASGFSAYGQNDDRDTEATVTQISQLQWRVTWEDWSSANPMNCIFDKTNEIFTPYLTSADNQVTKIYYTQQIIFPDYGKYFTVNLEGLNLPDGEYELTIPEAYVALMPGNEPNVTQYLTLIIGDMPEISHQVKISEINNNIIDIYWENVTKLTPEKTNGAYIQHVTTGKTFDMQYLQGDNYSTANLRIVNDFLRLNITNNHPDLPNGDFKLYLPAGYVKFNDGNTNEAIDGYEFSYAAPWSEGPKTISGPDSDDIITVIWTNAAEVFLNESFRGEFGINGPMVFYGTESEQAFIPASQFLVDGNTVTVNISGLGITNGSCRFLIPDGYLYINNNGETGLNEGVYYDFTYENGEDPSNPGEDNYPLYDGNATWNIKSGDKVEFAANPVSVTWGGNKISFVENPDDFVNLYGSFVGYRTLEYGTEVTVSEDGTKLLINLGNLPSDTYRLNVPEACVYIEQNNEIYVNTATSIDNLQIDNSSSVEKLDAENSTIEIYNIQGTKITDGLENLPKGIYIINGKKIIK